MKARLVVAVLLLGLTASGAPSAWAVEPERAKDFLEDLANRALAALRADDERLAKFGRMVIDGVDFVALSKGALGRLGRGVEQAKLEEVADLLAAVVVNNAADRLKEVAVTGIAVGNARGLPNEDVLVKAAIEMLDREAVELGWRIAERDNGLKIVDIEVDGHSLRIHFQNMFERKMRYGGVDGLIRSLRRKVDGTQGIQWVREASLRRPVTD